ncbi:hypothetical protein [Methylobacterium organophilum]|uniref:Uncharacterized protein n=1 Tax=Methylobacterium organophilum TaxID=410 RepID=A0ABQ4THF1_METOR|nr:hypothetical protein [Methylobacterium organophilum]GJE29769.1 hypothetical protein LKMONMHP_4655 [Methylobacterium organophilum]
MNPLAIFLMPWAIWLYQPRPRDLPENVIDLADERRRRAALPARRL